MVNTFVEKQERLQLQNKYIKMVQNKRNRRKKIKLRIRKRISGTLEMPRLTVFRSNRDIYAQIIDDENGKTLVSVSSRNKDIASKKGNKTEQSVLVGKTIADEAQKEGISRVKFDRNGYLYHGRVKSLAESAKENGLKI